MGERAALMGARNVLLRASAKNQCRMRRPRGVLNDSRRGAKRVSQKEL
jgi:hypothetical protein